ncbi:MAG: sulfatase-like hydrolase/transferase [Planctomycetota bacterium]
MLIGRLLLACALVLAYTGATSAERPNIVLIFVDDMGYGCAGSYGDTNLVPMPNVDRLAAEGVRFTDGYVTAPGCGPSRYGLLLGAYQQRFGVQHNRDTWNTIPRFPNETLDNNRIPATHLMINQALSLGGYATAMVGKSNMPCYPQSTFDETWSPMTFGGDYFPDEHGNYGGVSDPNHSRGFKRILWGPERPGDEYLTDRLGRQAVSFIERNAHQPFFLYLAFNAPHSPMQAKAAYKPRVAHLKTEATRLYGAMMISMDENVGRVIDALERMGIDDNTIVAFSSDNGPSFAYRVEWPEDWPRELLGSAGPLRAHKGSFYEGGIRVPYTLRWPAKLKPGQVFADPVSTMDLYPTFTAAAGIDPPETTKLDGVNLLPYLRGEKTGLADRTLYWWWYDQGSMRRGPWKMVPYGKQRELFNLKDDIGETTDLSKQHPEVFNAMTRDYDAFRASMPPVLFPHPKLSQ